MLGAMRILVIEDERALAGFIEQSLRAESYAVTIAHDGQSGEIAALTGDYGLVLLDLTLPGKTGLDVLDTIRAQAPELPVIVLTARATIEEKVQGLDRGANDYLTKPFSFEELHARVRTQLRAPQQREPATLQTANIRMDLRTRRVERDRHPVQPTSREFGLRLPAYVTDPGQPPDGPSQRDVRPIRFALTRNSSTTGNGRTLETRTGAHADNGTERSPSRDCFSVATPALFE